MELSCHLLKLALLVGEDVICATEIDESDLPNVHWGLSDWEALPKIPWATAVA